MQPMAARGREIGKGNLKSGKHIKVVWLMGGKSRRKQKKG